MTSGEAELLFGLTSPVKVAHLSMYSRNGTVKSLQWDLRQMYQLLQAATCLFHASKGLLGREKGI